MLHVSDISVMLGLYRINKKWAVFKLPSWKYFSIHWKKPSPAKRKFIEFIYASDVIKFIKVNIWSACIKQWQGAKQYLKYNVFISIPLVALLDTMDSSLSPVKPHKRSPPGGGHGDAPSTNRGGFLHSGATGLGPADTRGRYMHVNRWEEVVFILHLPSK